MQHRGHARGRTGLHVGRTTHDHAGHRQCAQETAQHIAHTLRRQFTVVVGACALMHAIHRCRRQQGFCAGDEGKRHRRHQQGRVEHAEDVRDAGDADRREQVGRYIDLGDVQTLQLHCSRDRHHRDQRTRQEPQTLRTQLVPRQDDADGGQTHEQGGSAGAFADRLPQHGRQCSEVFQTAGLGCGIHQHMRLRGHDQDADTGQHAGHHGRRCHAEPHACTAQTGDQLNRTGQQDHRPERGDAVLPDQLEHQHSQAGGRPTHLQRRTRHKANDQTTDDAGDQTCGRRHAGCDRNAHTQRERDEEDNDRRQ